MVLSFRPSMWNCPLSLNSTISFVIKVSEFTDGAEMISVPSSERLRETLSKGVYHSEASLPFRRLSAMCDSVSVIP